MLNYFSKEDFMCRFIVMLLLFIVSIPVSVSRTVVTRSPNYDTSYGAYYGGDYKPNVRLRNRSNYSRFFDINELERYAMNRNFTKDSDITRLERLEELAYGAVQQGDIYTRYDNVRNAILTRPKQDYKTSLIRNISDYFTGKLTGYTPNINQDDFDIDFSDTSFGKSSATNYVSPYHRGYRTNNYGIGSGMGVHLLD